MRQCNRRPEAGKAGAAISMLGSELMRPIARVEKREIISEP